MSVHLPEETTHRFVDVVLGSGPKSSWANPRTLMATFLSPDGYEFDPQVEPWGPVKSAGVVYFGREVGPVEVR